MELVGAVVEAHGLVGRADLNGTRGRVLKYDEAKGRCAVKFGDESVLIRPDNLSATATVPHAAAGAAAGGSTAAAAATAGDEESLIVAVQKLRLEQPQATAKALHASLSGDWPNLSLGDVKKAASKAAKRAPPGASSSAVSPPQLSPAAAPAVPFEAGSGVTHLDGRKLHVVKCKNGVAKCRARGGQTLDVPQHELVLIDTPRQTAPTAYDLIVQSPSVARIDQCDILARVVAERAAPPQLAQRRWDTFSDCGRRCGSRTLGLEAVVTNAEISWKVPAGLPPARSRLIYLALDAMSHHVTIEWRFGRGWRVIQSYMKQDRYREMGYTALEWVTSTRACGTDASAHRRFGQGRWLSDEEVLEFLRAIMRMRRLADTMVTDCLLAQTPFPIGQQPAQEDKQALLAWLHSVQPVGQWAAEKIHAAETHGATLLRSAALDYAQVVLGDPAVGGEFDALLRIPMAAATELDEAYAAITGEEFGAIHYLRLLNYVESDYGLYSPSKQEREREHEREAERERLFCVSELNARNRMMGLTEGVGEPMDEDSVKGWAVRCIHWPDD